ncbi:redoxin domain-containing protein [bacterium]|nr:redoxin domain-containing protein [bacterium]
MFSLINYLFSGRRFQVIAGRAIQNAPSPAKRFTRVRIGRVPFVLGLLIAASSIQSARAAEATPPKVGAMATDFTLKTLDGQSVRLRDLTNKGNVVLVVLRGWPGYQCPICDRQVHDYIAHSNGFAEAKAQLLFVYPGPADDLKAHAEEFKSWKGKEWPKEYLYVLDPNYSMVNAYHLRWDAPRETAYPSTFVIDKSGKVRFAKISHSHGDRSKAADVLAEVKKLTE